MLQATRSFSARAFPLARCSAVPSASSVTGRAFSSSSVSFARQTRTAAAAATTTTIAPIGGTISRTARQWKASATLVLASDGMGVVSRSPYAPNSLAFQSRLYSSAGEEIVVTVPNMGDSITSGSINTWLKKTGDSVLEDDIVCQIDTDKVTADVRSPVSGVITETIGNPQDNANVGDVLFKVKKGAVAEKPAPTETKPSTLTPAPETKQQPVAAAASAPPPPPPQASKPATGVPPTAAAAAAAPTPSTMGTRTERRVPMTRMRLRIAERLKDSQNTSAMLTTFNEVDMSKLMEMRSKYKDEFEKKHGVKLGFMSAFVKATAMALKEQPGVNAVIDGKDIVYRDYVDISVAVATPTGLVVPVLRDCQDRSFASIEKAIGDFGERARTGKLAIEEMQGGTFTISNGGVFGSLYGTPIINPPQSAILGMHTVKWRPICDPENNNAIVARPMMYLALTYDHRLIDGKDAVTFLVRIKNCIEDPRRFLLEL